MKKIFFIFIILLLSLSFFVIKPYYLFLKRTLKISILKTFFSQDSLKNYLNQVNILVLGIPGENNDGPYLSDSIIVANYNFEKNRLITISIPRDIWSKTLRDKINSAYAYGYIKNNNYLDGLKLAKAEVSGIIGLPIHYGVVIDFSKFEQLIDSLGGIEVEIDNSFVDYKFPIPGKENDDCGGKDPEFKCRYETVYFKKGKMFMDGKTALKFVRSRNAVGEEGNDFAREKRQQKVMLAIEKKALNELKKPNIKNWEKIYFNIDQLIKRDITNQQAAIILRNLIFKNLFSKNKFNHKSGIINNDLFVVPDYYLYGGRYVLIPKSGNFDEIKKNILKKLE